MIGSINESGLHNDLKQLYAGDRGRTEVDVDGYVVDVLLPDEIVEVQTRNLGRLKPKLAALSASHFIRLVHPVAVVKHLVTVNTHGEVLSARLSPKHGRVEDAFREISAVGDLLPHPRLVIEVVLVEVTEHRLRDGRGSWRRGGVSITGRHLDAVVERRPFVSAADYLALLPPELGEPFTNRDLGAATGMRYAVVQPLTATLRKAGLIAVAHRSGRELAYRRA